MGMKITVGIATWNRATLLAQTLESLTKLRIPQTVSWEVLVCDNNSSDHTKQVVEAEIAKGRLRVKYVFEPTQGKGYALNTLLHQAQGDWVLFTDDDVLVDGDWLASYQQAIERHPQAVVLSGTVKAEPVRAITAGERYLLETFPWINALFEVPSDQPMTTQPGQMGNGNNLAVRSSVARDIGFDTHRCMTGHNRGGEDTVFITSALQQGYQGWRVAGPVVHHVIPESRLGRRWLWQWHVGLGREMYFTQGPAPAGWRNLRWWHYKRIARLLMLSLLRRFTGRRKQAYETYAQAAAEWGYLSFSRDRAQSDR